MGEVCLALTSKHHQAGPPQGVAVAGDGMEAERLPEAQRGRKRLGDRGGEA